MGGVGTTAPSKPESAPMKACPLPSPLATSSVPGYIGLGGQRDHRDRGHAHAGELGQGHVGSGDGDRRKSGVDSAGLSAAHRGSIAAARPSSQPGEPRRASSGGAGKVEGGSSP
jgi:hypothetical protein